MSRYRGPRLKITRRLGDLPGLVQKRSASQNPPGEHGATRGKLSQYAIRLQEKQKIRYHYGVTERQLWRYVQKARRTKGDDSCSAAVAAAVHSCLCCHGSMHGSDAVW